MFETDYPHNDGTWPHSKRAAAEQFGHLDDGVDGQDRPGQRHQISSASTCRRIGLTESRRSFAPGLEKTDGGHAMAQPIAEEVPTPDPDGVVHRRLRRRVPGRPGGPTPLRRHRVARVASPRTAPRTSGTPTVHTSAPIWASVAASTGLRHLSVPRMAVRRLAGQQRPHPVQRPDQRSRPGAHLPHRRAVRRRAVLVPPGPGRGSAVGDPRVIDAIDGKEIAESYDWVVAAPWQEIAENGFDIAHFVSVHGLDQLGTLGDVVVRRAVAADAHREHVQDQARPLRRLAGVDLVRAGCRDHAVPHLRRCLPARAHQPDRRGVHARPVPLGVRRRRGIAEDRAPLLRRGEAPVRTGHPIWEAKRYLPRPALASIEKPIMDFRSWAARFYPEETTA